jgi:hypothetical protein
MLSSSLRLFALTSLCSLASSCGDKPPWVELPSEATTYKLAVRTFQTGEAIAEPFQLGFRSSKPGGRIHQILSAEHCKNVEVFQEQEELIIFYDDLALTHFSGGEHYTIPRPLLCDNHYAVCQNLRKDYGRRGRSGVSVCTLR